MNGFTRNRAGTVHPNAIVAKRELERQEQERLRRLSDVRPSSAHGKSPAARRQAKTPWGNRLGFLQSLTVRIYQDCSGRTAESLENTFFGLEAWRLLQKVA